MNSYDDLFGGLFDLNGDGRTDPAEQIIGLNILNAMEEEEETEDDE